MSMSKRDYQSIARAINSVLSTWRAMPMDAIHERTIAWQDTRDAIAGVLATDNPRFDRARFVEACETGKCKGMPR